MGLVNDVLYSVHFIFIYRDTLLILTQNAEVQFTVENLDAYIYDQLLSVLMPNVIAQLPCKHL